MSRFESNEVVNNRMYDSLGEKWYSGEDHPVALLRAEARLKNPWVLGALERRLGDRRWRILDVGCGGGLLSNALALAGHEVTGLDLSAESLEVARRFDATRSVSYQLADAADLPLGDASFDSVCAMDLLEHVEDPRTVIQESARVLRPDGLFFFHTFNRNWLSWLVAIKGVEWFVKGTPENLHVLKGFIKPRELRRLCLENGLNPGPILGMRPELSTALVRLLLTGEVSDQFRFIFHRFPWVGYCGYACKRCG